MKNPHSAEEDVLGWVLLALAVALIVEVVRGRSEGRLRFLWPGLGAVLGIGLAGFVFFERWLYQAIGWIAGIASIVEVLRRAGRVRGRGAEAAWPLAMVGIGLVFLAHEQGTAEALLVHWALSGTLILAGLAQVAPVLVGEESRALRAFGGLLLVGAALQLVVYDEKPGAHGEHEAAHN